MGVVFPQGWGEDEPQVFIERDEVAVERGIEGGRQAQAILRVEAPHFILYPRRDVAGSHDLRDVQASNAAAVPVIIQHHAWERY